MRHIRRNTRIAPILLLVAPLLSADTVSREALLKQYCLQCHNSKLKSGNLILEGASTADPSANPEIWAKVVRKLTAGESPPPKLPRPEAAAVQPFTTGLISDLDAAAGRKPYAG